MTNDEMRKKFKDSKLSYRDIGSREIATLKSKIIEALNRFNEDDNFTMKLNVVRKGDQSFLEHDGSIEYYFFRVTGKVKGESPYFKGREAISFNRDGFVGFAGWADSRNVKPFLDAFSEWIDFLINNKKAEQ